MADKTESFTFRINSDTRAALEQIASDKEWSAGHLARAVLADYVASVKPAKAKRSAKPATPAAVAPPRADEPF